MEHGHGCNGGGTPEDSLLDMADLALCTAIICSGTRRICVFGTDDSSIAADVMSDLADEVSDVPLVAVNDGRVPGWISEDVTSVLISYAGNCPCVTSAYDELLARGFRMICITSGGELERRCRRDGTPMVRVPSGLGFRGATGYVLGTLSAIVQESGVFPAADMLRDAMGNVRRMPLEAQAAPVAARLSGRIIAVYSTSDIHACSKRWKIGIEREASDVAFYGELPEFDHNELVGWADPNDHARDLTMVVLRGVHGPGLVSDIVGCMFEVLGESGRDVVSIHLGDGSSIERNLVGIIIGDEVSKILGGSA